MNHPLRVWTPDDADYPYRLQQCPDKPNPLYVRGNVPPGGEHVVAIVGTRQPTERGKELTETLVRELHERLDHVIIVSGGAYGIDIAAHRAALKYGVPTIMVLAHGLDRIYPAQHKPEAEQAMENGGLVSEYEVGTDVYAGNFLQRNRIIAGLADAVVIVESKEKGGSLCTAQRAYAYKRALFAFPGRPNDVGARGCNELIRKGYAQLIDGADDLIRAMEWKTKKEKAEGVQMSLVGLTEELTAIQRTLLTKLQAAEEGMHINMLVMETGLPYSEVASELMTLELQGLVRSLPGGIYRFVR